MMNIKIGNNYLIHSYKHDGNIHKVWDEAILLEDNDEFLIFGNNNTKVTKADGRVWRTKDPSIMFFYKKHWFSVIAQIKDYGIQYKCDIASPYIIDDKALKYIDYDLDLKVFPNGSFKVLDRKEYQYHREKMNYPDELDIILKKELSKLIEIVRKKEIPFNPEYVNSYYKLYSNIKNKINL